MRPYPMSPNPRRPMSPEQKTSTRRRSAIRRARRALAAVLLALASISWGGVFAVAPASAAVQGTSASAAAAAPSAGSSGGSLEAAATKAGDTGRKVAMSLIGLGFAIAAIVLSFKRDFKEAAGIFAVGLVAVLLATPAGLNLLRSTVTSLFGA
jgi:FtsH-binding integral membrane protein